VAVQHKVEGTGAVILAGILVASCGGTSIPSDYEPLAPSLITPTSPTPGNPPRSCTYRISPDALTAGYEGGEGVVVVTAPAGCAWTAESSVSWISVTRATGSGNGSVTFLVAPMLNQVFPRRATLMVAGQVVSITQVLIPGIGVGSHRPSD
jgi:hypothetical protein